MIQYSTPLGLETARPRRRRISTSGACFSVDRPWTLG